jgi:hypothetical protein
MKSQCFIWFSLFSLGAAAQFNNMNQDFIADKGIAWIKASYFEEGKNPNYQIFYQFDSIGRVVESTTSDDILTFWTYDDLNNVSVKSTVNPAIGNKIMEYAKGWQTYLVVIHSSEGDSIYHNIVYDTINTAQGKFIECYDIVYPGSDTTYRQVFDMDGKMRRYEILSDGGKVIASYTYVFIDGKLDYTEYYEGGEFIYKEKFTYYPDTEMRKQRVSVAGDDMFSNEETRYVTMYLINDEGLLYEEVEYLGKEHTSTIGYNYEYYSQDEEEDE